MGLSYSSPLAPAGRLPQLVRPTSYNLSIRTDLKEGRFDGRVEIDLTAKKKAAEIVLHASKALTIGEIYLRSDDGLHESPKSVKFDTDVQRMTIMLHKALSEGERVKLGISWIGSLTSVMAGYIKGTYSLDGRDGMYAVTSLAPCDARSVFPCWDEPEIKATYDLTMIYARNTIAIANTDEIERRFTTGTFPTSAYFPFKEDVNFDTYLDPSWSISRFRTTPLMSTYLVAWANGPFEYLTSEYTSPLTGRIVPIHVYSLPEQLDKARFVLESMAEVTPLYEKLFNLAFPLPKLDLLTIGAYSSGAMENWGLIVGGTSIFLYDDITNGLSNKQITYNVCTHEIGHQWFGNVVTMKWWDNLWLNESFATFITDVVVTSKTHPEWKPVSEFISKTLGVALELDSLRSSHQIEMPCPDDSVVYQMFDTISYNKGASVLRMLCSFLGEEVFLQGVAKYLKEHVYGNSTSPDLWRALSAVSKIDVENLMANWTLMPGYPLVTVTESDGVLEISQKRFLSTGRVKPDEDEALWHIPLNIRSMGKDGKISVDSMAILSSRAMAVARPPSGMFKLNSDTNGFYRVKYSPEQMERLGDQAKTQSAFLSVEDRMGLALDAVPLSKSGDMCTSTALQLLDKLRSDDEYAVWSIIRGGLLEMNITWANQPQEVRNALQCFRRSLYAPIVQRLGFDPQPDDIPSTVLWRADAVAQAADAGDPSTLKELQRRYALLVEKDDDSSITADLQLSVFKYGVCYGSAPEYETAYKVARTTTSDRRRRAAICGLCSTQRPDLLSRTFDLILAPDTSLAGELLPGSTYVDHPDRHQDVIPLVDYLGSNETARPELWVFLKRNFEEVLAKFGGTYNFNPIMIRFFSPYSSYEDASAFEQFFRNKDTKLFSLVLHQGLENIRCRAGWVERDAEDVKEWLKSHGYLDVVISS